MTESEIQQALLEKLEEYGESMLESSEKKHKKKKKHETDSLEADWNVSSNKNNPTESEKASSLNKRRKKKKRKLHESESCNTDSDETLQNNSNKVSQSGKIRHLESIKSDLGLTEFKSRQLEKERVKEGSKSRMKKEPEVVVFTSHKRKQREESNSSDGRSSSNNPEFDLRQARFEVRKFGIKGFQGDKKEEAMTSLLVRLGAKPPKNKCYNYVEYQEMRKKEMVAEKEKRELDRKLGYKIPKATNDRKRKRDRNDIGIVDGQVGRWKSGVQFVKKNDLKGLKKSKIKF